MKTGETDGDKKIQEEKIEQEGIETDGNKQRLEE